MEENGKLLNGIWFHRFHKLTPILAAPIQPLKLGVVIDSVIPIDNLNWDDFKFDSHECDTTA